MISKDILNILACPETHQDLTPADAKLVEQINVLIGQGVLRNRANEKIIKKIDGGLVRQDRKYLYPVRENIPILLIDEAIALEKIN